MSYQVEQHALSALCGWVTAQLAPFASDANVGAIKTYDKWPEASVKLIIPSVSLFLVGTSTQYEHDPAPIARDDSTTPPTYTWAFRFADYPFQVDVWADSSAVRWKIAAAVEKAFKAGRAPLGITNRDPIENSVLVPMTGDFVGTVDASVKAPEAFDTADSIDRSEYRATFQGLLSVQSTLKAQSPRLTNPQLSARLNGVPYP